MSDKAFVRSILESNLYCTIATVCDDGTPWNTPVFFGYDDDFNIYWRSSFEAQHSRNATAQSRVAITVFDSTAPWGESKGLYILGNTTVLENESEIAQGLVLIDARTPKRLAPADFMPPNPRRIYTCTPTRIWTNVSTMQNGQFADARQELEWAA